jgi:Radical SAM superfamily
MNVGVLELISFTVPPEWRPQWAAARLRRHLYSVMPQVVAAWARRLGHRVHYATYYGQTDPIRLLPDDLDVVFISSATQASALACALAKCYRRAGALTVLGGPHAKCFPADSLRFFDVVVAGPCDRELVADILGGHIGPGSAVAARNRPTDFPSVEERLPDIKIASFTSGKPRGLHCFGLLGSVGCPYTCNFCTEWNSPYAPLSPERLTADLKYIASNYPKAVVAYHDPNFAVRFDQTMDAIEAAGPPYPRYVMNCSLSVLRDERLERLRRTNCVFVAPGVESWYDYGNKAAAGERAGRAKLDYVVGRFRELRRHVPGLQANFLFGTDEDRGREPADLTIEFIRRLPYLWPNVNTPTPYGGTPLFDQYLAEGRILQRLPLAFYCAPYLATTLKNYDPPSYYRLLLGIHGAATDRRALLRRVGARNPLGVRLAHLSQTLSYRTQLREMHLIRDLLEQDRAFRAFHDNDAVGLPEFYHRRFEHRLGRYAGLIGRAERQPVLEAVPVQAA